MHCLSKVSRSSVESLVDRISNGRVEGNDVRFMSRHLDRTADVRRICNHEIKYVHLVTAGRVALSTSGEVIVIMHQHAYDGKNQMNPFFSTHRALQECSA